MAKIQVKRALPAEPPAPRTKPDPGAAPPFTPAPPKPRHAAPAAPAVSAQNRRQTRPNMLSDERHAGPLPGRMRDTPLLDLAGEPAAGTRFDGVHGKFVGEFFSDPGADSMETGCARSMLKEAMQAAALEQGLDCAALARLLPAGRNDGIFDVVLPTGERLGVVVSGQSSSLSYLLSPSPEKFGSRLRRQRMELEERMERLTHRNVKITVL